MSKAKIATIATIATMRIKLKVWGWWGDDCTRLLGNALLFIQSPLGGYRKQRLFKLSCHPACNVHAHVSEW